MKLGLFTAIVLILMLFSSCATILNPRKQPVHFDIKNDTHLTVKDGNRGTAIKKDSLVAPNQTAYFSRDGFAKGYTFSKEGYKTEHRYVIATKISPLILLDFWALPVLALGRVVDLPEFIYPAMFYTSAGPVFDLISKKGYNYPKSIIVDDSLKKLPSWEPSQFKVTMKNFEVDLGSDDIVFQKHSYKKYVKGDDTPKSVTDYGVPSYFNSNILNRDLNFHLEEWGYTQVPMDALTQSQGNDRFIKASLKSVQINQYSVMNKGAFLTVVADVSWEFTDYFGNTIFSKEIRSTSGHFSEIDDAVQDALEFGLIELMNDPETQEILSKSNYTDKELKNELIYTKGNGSYVENVKDALKATVTVITDNGHGSGFFINDSLIITNFHVIANSDYTTVKCNNGTKLEATLVRTNEIYDLAILQVEKTDIAPFLLQKIEAEIGTEIYTIGTPASQDLAQTISRGIVSGQRESSEGKYIQIDAKVNAGNSGGPLIDKQGNLLGVVVSKLVGIGTEGLAFCIPMDTVLESLQIKIAD